VLIAGTGSICFGVANDGHAMRVGGWGGELGDEGSGFWIGLRALQSACRMADGRLARTDLIRKVLAKLGVANPEDLIPWSSSKSRAEFKTAVAALYPVVAAQAAEGDATAKQALLLGIGHLIQHVLAAAGRIEEHEKKQIISADTQTHDVDITYMEGEDIRPKRKFDLVCAGGLFTGDKDFYDTFVFQLKRKKDNFRPIRLLEPASLGALLLGQDAMPAMSGARN
jgi:hypothetical protein